MKKLHFHTVQLSLVSLGCAITNNMSITGCAICLFKSDNEVFICEENRVVLSYAEQEEMDCKQPFMLPKTTLSVHGTPMEPVHLGRLIHKRMNKLENIDFNVPDDDARRVTPLNMLRLPFEYVVHHRPSAHDSRRVRLKIMFFPPLLKLLLPPS